MFAAVVAVGVVAGSSDPTDDDAGQPVVEIESTTLAPSTTSTVSETTVASSTKVPLSTTLSTGMTGDEVRIVQQRLADLNFVPGPIDGVFGSLTQQAVWAFEKLVLGTERAQVTGQVTPAVWDRMQDSEMVSPRRPNPGTRNHTEIYLPEQAIVVFHDDSPVFIAHMSSGTGDEWCQEVTISPGEYGNVDGEEPLKLGRCGISVTPGGVFNYDRQIEGHRQSALGGMLNPVYFNYGIAVHGAYNVPLQPASRGCIRIANAISEEFYDLVDLGDLVFVFDGVKEPEEYGAQLPVFDWPDPEYTTTTTSTTTTTTTVPETTTTVPETTTTVPETTTVAPTTTTGSDAQSVESSATSD